VVAEKRGSLVHKKADSLGNDLMNGIGGNIGVVNGLLENQDRVHMCGMAESDTKLGIVSKLLEAACLPPVMCVHGLIDEHRKIQASKELGTVIGRNLSKLCAVGERPDGAERQFASVLARIETSEQESEIAGKRLVVVVLQKHRARIVPNV